MLTERERTVLDIECQHWRTASGKEDQMRRAGLSATRYYQILNSLTDDAEGWEYAPAALARVQRLRERRGGGRI